MLKFNIGDRLVVQLATNEVYEGEYVSGSDNRIEIKNVFENQTRNSLGPQVLTFYRSEIANVHLLAQTNGHHDETPGPSTPEPSDNIIKICETEYNQLKALTKDYKYIPCMDANYYSVVEILCNCESIGMVGLNLKPGRGSKLDLLVCATWEQVYIFDLLLFNKSHFPKELKEIITSPDITKIVHDGRPLVDCLHHCHKITMENIFDTQVADMMIEKKLKKNDLANFRNIGECFQVYFNFPNHVFKNALNINRSKWNKRPMSDGTKHSASLLAAYLITLKNHLQRLLLKDFLDTVNAYNKSTLDKSAVETQTLLNTTDIGELMSDLKIAE